MMTRGTSVPFVGHVGGARDVQRKFYKETQMQRHADRGWSVGGLTLVGLGLNERGKDCELRAEPDS